MSKKVFIGVGHGGKDSGAVGNGLKEKDVNLSVAKAISAVLIDHGVAVLLSRKIDETEGLSERIKECNAFDADLAIDVHHNAGGGDGFEIYHYHGGGTGKTMAQNIENEVIAIGQNSRGLKTKLNYAGTDYFGFIRQTNCPAVLCEGAFLDNAKDVQIVNSESKRVVFGTAIAKGILKTLGIAYEPPVENKTIYKVQVGAYSEKANAETTLNMLKKSGFDGFVTEVRG